MDVAGDRRRPESPCVILAEIRAVDPVLTYPFRTLRLCPVFPSAPRHTPAELVDILSKEINARWRSVARYFREVPKGGHWGDGKGSRGQRHALVGCVA